MNRVEKILNGLEPDGFAFAPNYWQWFSHQQNHGILPEEIQGCRTQLDLIRFLGLDVFSRNIYCKQDDYWFGGICDEYFDGIETLTTLWNSGTDKQTRREYHLKAGLLTEQLSYIFKESTVVQKEFLITDYVAQAALLEEFVATRKWRFNPVTFESHRQQVGDDGVVVVGDFFSPLKMLHLVMNPVQSVYFLMDQPEFAASLMAMHEKAQLDAIRQCVSQGVQVVMAMDNLDTQFHPPSFVETYSASFYEKASALCHEYDARFFIHACGNQRENLPLISSYGVDGLEGVAFPPLGNVQLDEAMRLTHDRFIITGGISAMETRNLTSSSAVKAYITDLFSRMEPYRHRFLLSASCNTPIDTTWDTIRNFRDAWREYNGKYHE